MLCRIEFFIKFNSAKPTNRLGETLYSVSPNYNHYSGRMGIKMKLVNIGFGNMVSANRMVAIVSPESAPIKRIIQDSKERGALIDATHGRRTRAVIITDSDHIILTYLQAETLANRIAEENSIEGEDEEDE